MKNIRIIIQDEETRQALTRCQFLTNHATAAKAIAVVIAEYPDLREKVATLEVELAKAKAERTALKNALETTLWGDKDLDRRIKEAINDGLQRRQARMNDQKRPKVHLADVDDPTGTKTLCGRQVSKVATTEGDPDAATCDVCKTRYDFGTLTR